MDKVQMVKELRECYHIIAHWHKGFIDDMLLENSDRTESILYDLNHIIREYDRARRS